MKKLFPFAAFLALAAVCLAAPSIVILWYSQAPHVASLNDNDISLIERPSPHTNLWFYMAQLKSYAVGQLTNVQLNFATTNNGPTLTNIIISISGSNTPSGTSPFTNSAGLTWRTGMAMPDITGALPGPPFFFQDNGSLLSGTNITADVVIDPANIFLPSRSSFVDSNQEPNIYFGWNVANNLGYSRAGYARGAVQKLGGNYRSEMQQQGIKGDGTFLYYSSWKADPGTDDIGFLLRKDGVDHVKLGYTGIIWADSLTEGQWVAVGADGQLINTNPPSAGSLTNVQLNFATTNDSPTLTNIIKSFATNVLSQNISGLMPVVTPGSNILITTNASGTQTNYTVAIDPNVALQNGNNVFTGSNHVTKGWTISTNVCAVAADFSKPGQTLSTNANFTWLAPLGIDLSGKAEQWLITHVTNSAGSGSPITMTKAAGVNLCGSGSMVVTNWSEVVWEYIPPSGPTNMWPKAGY